MKNYQRFPLLLFSCGLFMLAAEPILWLVNSWFEASYDSDGLWIFLLFSTLLLWSLSSPCRQRSRNHFRLALGLLLATAAIRLAGQILAINVIAALALVVDVYAIGLLLNLSGRTRPLSPLWLALLFACALPLERLLQRTFGFALQQLSAWSSCSVLQHIDDRILCSGTRIQLPNETLMIDLPCSGANALLLLTLVMTTLMALARPSKGQAVIAMLLVLLAAWLSNSLRIFLLAWATLQPIFGIDVFQQPWHEIVGLLALLPAFGLIFSFYLKRAKEHNTTQPATTSYVSQRRFSNQVVRSTALAFLLLALFIVTRSPQPLDVSQHLEAPYLPLFLAGEWGQNVPLLEKEKAYFEQYGGTAIKRQYAERGVLITHTDSPLRHLHAPDECLRGLGFSVDYLGSIDSVVPTAVYRAVSPEGQVWKVSVSFISANGTQTTNVAEAVWLWLQSPQRWYAIQRISPWESPNAADQAWDQALFAALDYI